MSGFPTRMMRTPLGPTLVDERPVIDPSRELSAAPMNAAWWQIAGLGQVSPRVVFLCTVSGGAVTVAQQHIAWDPNAALADVTFTYEAAGFYSFSLSASYADELGTLKTLDLEGMAVVPVDGAPYTGAHDGGNNVATLQDTTQAWTVNALIGKLVYNVTDGSSATITANTADTITAVLAGGGDNDWDTSDVYLVLDPEYYMRGTLDSVHSGRIVCVDSTGALADCPAFLALIW